MGVTRCASRLRSTVVKMRWPAWLPRALALHAFAAGGIGLATLAKMARVPLISSAHYDLGIALAQILWSAAFACFVVAHAPMLRAPRPDGADG